MIFGFIRGIVDFFTRIVKYVFGGIKSKLSFLIQIFEEDNRSINFRKDFIKKQRRVFKVNNQI